MGYALNAGEEKLDWRSSDGGDEAIALDLFAHADYFIWTWQSTHTLSRARCQR